MFLSELGSSDERFKKLTFHDGMNILLADKTIESTLGNSRNGAGKTSFVNLFRFLMGGRRGEALDSTLIRDHRYWAKILLDDASGPIKVERALSQTKLTVGGVEYSVEAWRNRLSDLFSLPAHTRYPTVGQLVSQIARTYFGDPLKVFPSESNWQSGMRTGYFLGFSPEILAKAGEVEALEKNRRALRKAFEDGALGGQHTSEAELRAQLAKLRGKRDRMAEDIAQFTVDEQYHDHQADADRLTRKIRDLNDEALVLERRKHELEAAIEQERPGVSDPRTNEQLKQMYAQIGVVLPEASLRRFSEVTEFHESVRKNRRIFLESELSSIKDRLAEISLNRRSLDSRRAKSMSLLEGTMALETFRDAERELTELTSNIANLEQQLSLVQAVSERGVRLRAMESEAEASVRTEIEELGSHLDKVIDQFQQLGEEIYDDRAVSLLIEATKKGQLKVQPTIDGDTSAGIQGVKAFLLDIVCVASAIELGRAPRILIHDSQLFDSMDDRQISSCLNIGARLSEERGFQYIVTINSDRLTAAEEEGFDRRDYVLSPTLTDADEEGGLFGFRFQ